MSNFFVGFLEHYPLSMVSLRNDFAVSCCTVAVKHGLLCLNLDTGPFNNQITCFAKIFEISVHTSVAYVSFFVSPLLQTAIGTIQRYNTVTITAG